MTYCGNGLHSPEREGIPVILRATCVSRRLTWMLLGVALVAAVSGSRAQPARDPTMPPPGATGAAAPGTAEPANPIDAGPVAVIVRDGRPYLVVGTRLYGQGQMLGGARIERIGETEVWLREGKTLRKKPLFGGIERRAAATAAPVRPCPPSSSKKPTLRGSPSEICPP